MIVIVNNSKNLYKATMTPKLLNILDSWNIKYILINNKKDLKKKKFIISLPDIKGIILTGGPLCISDNIYYKDVIKNLAAMQICPNVPILGICFGFQILADVFGGSVDKLNYHHLGFKQVDTSHTRMKLFNNIKPISTFFFSHNDHITTIPGQFNYCTFNNIIICIEHIDKQIYGVQFHPEGSTDGHAIIKNFIFNICYI